MNKKKFVSIITSVATVAMTTAGAFLPIAAGAVSCGDPALDFAGGTSNAFGSLGTGVGQFDEPFDVHVDSAGNIYVADFNVSRLQKFTSAGAPALSFAGGTSNVIGGLADPTGVHVDSSGNIYVVEASIHRIQKFTSAGAPALSFAGGTSNTLGIFGSGVGELNNPRDVYVDSSGNIFVTELGNHRIQKFTSAGAPALSFAGGTSNTLGSIGGGVGQFSVPFRLHVDSAGNIYVVETANSRIQKFTSAGAPALSFAGGTSSLFGSLGTGVGQFSSPTAVHVDSAGNIYVMETGNNRIQKFDSAGAPALSFAGGTSNILGSAGSGVGQFSVPIGVHVDSAGNIYAADRGNHRIQKFACPAAPPLSTCAITALAAMGLNQGDFPNLESSLDAACVANPANVTTITAGSEPKTNLKLNPGEIVVLGEGANISNNIIGDNGSENAVYMGNNVTVSGNVLKSNTIWVGGTGNLITGNLNHEVDVNIGPNAYLRINGNLTDLQNLNIGASGTLDVGGNVDIYVSADIASGALLLVGGNLDCNGSPTVNNNGTVTAGTNNCSLLAALDGGGGGFGNLATLLPLIGLAALGMAIYVRPRKQA